jgi:hypothetical protein
MSAPPLHLDAHSTREDSNLGAQLPPQSRTATKAELLHASSEGRVASYLIPGQALGTG